MCPEPLTFCIEQATTACPTQGVDLGEVDVNISSLLGELANALTVRGYIPIALAQIREKMVAWFFESVWRDQHNTASAFFELIEKFSVCRQELRKVSGPIESLNLSEISNDGACPHSAEQIEM